METIDVLRRPVEGDSLASARNNSKFLGTLIDECINIPPTSFGHFNCVGPIKPSCNSRFPVSL